MLERNTKVPKSIEEFVTTQAQEILRDMNPDHFLGSQEENVAITLNKVKTAALCYDRVWCPLSEREHDQVPEPIRCWRISPLKIAIMSGSQKKISDLLKRALRPLARSMSKHFMPGLNVSFVTVYDSEAKRNFEYHEGDREAVVVTLSSLSIVDEELLSWEQVLEFRKDKENSRKYRRFLHWLDKEMIGRSQSFIEHEISLRLDDYENALKKHGIKTIVGTIEEVLDGRYLLGVSGVASSFTIAGHPVLGALAGSGLLVGKVGVKLMQTMLDFYDVERGANSEISWVYEAKKFGEDLKQKKRG
ncbi:MAG: hypothetical protein ACYS6W_13250 [Planctomycetota bacterium]